MPNFMQYRLTMKINHVAMRVPGQAVKQEMDGGV